MNRKLVFSSLILIAVLSSFAMVPAAGAAGTTGTMTVNIDSATEGSRVVLKLTLLTVSAEYSIEVEDTAVFNWTTSSTETTRFVPITLPVAGTDNAIKIELVDGAATVLDTKYLLGESITDQIPEDMVQETFVVFIGLFLFAGILIGISAGFVRKRRR